MKKTIKKAFMKSLPVMAGYLVLGTDFGRCGNRIICLEEKYVVEYPWRNSMLYAADTICVIVKID